MHVLDVSENGVYIPPNLQIAIRKEKIRWTMNQRPFQTPKPVPDKAIEFGGISAEI